MRSILDFIKDNDWITPNAGIIPNTDTPQIYAIPCACDMVSRNYNNLFMMSDTLCCNMADGLWIIKGSPLKDTEKFFRCNKYGDLYICDWVKSMGLYCFDNNAQIVCGPNGIISGDDPAGETNITPKKEIFDIVYNNHVDNDYAILCNRNWIDE